MLLFFNRRTHCCGHVVVDTNVSPFDRARNICCRDTKKCFFVQKHFVSQFAQPKKHHGQQCVRNNVSSLTRAFSAAIRTEKNKNFGPCIRAIFHTYCYYNFNPCGFFFWEYDVIYSNSQRRIETTKINARYNVRNRLKFGKMSWKDLLCTKM